MLFSDSTIEALLCSMPNSYHRKACISGESPFIDLLTGARYGGGDATMIACDLWDGASVKVDRKSSDSVTVQKACIANCSCFTPEAFHSRLKNARFNQGGFAQRFLYIHPRCRFEPASGNIDLDILDWWGKLVGELNITPTEGEDRVPVCHTLEFDTDALATLDTLSNLMCSISMKLHQDDEIELWKGWVTRVEAYVIRLAAIYHAVTYGGDYREYKINNENVDRAIHTMRYYMLEADRILHQQSKTNERNAQVIWKYLKRSANETSREFTIRRIQQGCGRNVVVDDKIESKAEAIRLAIEELLLQNRPIKFANKVVIFCGKC
jgi:hypothetical protein